MNILHSRATIKRKRRTRGFSLIDVAIATMVLAFGSLMMAALTPTMARSQHMADETSKASQMATKQIERLRLAGFNSLDRSTLITLGLLENTNDGTMVFTNLPMDGSLQFSPGAVLKNGKGTVQIFDAGTDAKEVVVRVDWTSASGKARDVILTTLVGKYS